MDLRQTALGLILFVVFWAFQVGYLNFLGSAGWLVGVVVLSVVLYLIGKGVMPKQSADMKELWMFTSLFAIVATIIFSYLGPYLGAVLPANPAQLTPLVLSFWLIVYGGALWVTGHEPKWKVTAWTGLFWLFSSTHFVTAVNVGANAYLHFGLVVGLPFIIYGLISR